MRNFNINISARNIELTEAVNDYARKKVLMVEKYIDADKDAGIFAQVELGKEVRNQMSGDIFIAEINLDIAGEVLNAKTEKGDLYAAIDEMKDEITRLIRRNKNKRRDLFRKGALKMKEMVRGLSGRK